MFIEELKWKRYDSDILHREADQFWQALAYVDDNNNEYKIYLNVYQYAADRVKYNSHVYTLEVYIPDMLSVIGYSLKIVSYNYYLMEADFNLFEKHGKSIIQGLINV